MTESLRRVAVVGGSRIPFCRSNTVYADKSNLDMLSAAINGIVQRFDLDGVHAARTISKTRRTTSIEEILRKRRNIINRCPNFMAKVDNSTDQFQN